MNDEMKLNKLAKFKKDFQKLMDKYPEILMMGDINGDVGGYISLQHPRVENKHGNIALTHQGKIL